MGSTLAKIKHNHTSSIMFALSPAFIRPTQSVFDELDLMANFFQPCVNHHEYVDKCEKLNANQLALNLPAAISGDQIKTTINKKTGILTVSAENNNENEFSRNGWTGKIFFKFFQVYTASTTRFGKSRTNGASNRSLERRSN